MNAIRPACLWLLLLLSCDTRFEFDKPMVSDVADCTERCAQWGQYCATGDWQEYLICVECNVDQDCKDADRPRCSDSDHRCVQCKASIDCKHLGLGYQCVSPDLRCVPGCTYGANEDDGVCADPAQRCGDFGVCGECDHDYDCAVGHCLASGQCAQCSTSAHCSGNTICDPVSHTCVECSDGRRCSIGCCNLETHKCY